MWRQNIRFPEYQRRPSSFQALDNCNTTRTYWWSCPNASMNREEAADARPYSAVRVSTGFLVSFVPLLELRLLGLEFTLSCLFRIDLPLKKLKNKSRLISSPGVSASSSSHFSNNCNRNLDWYNYKNVLSCNRTIHRACSWFTELRALDKLTLWISEFTKAFPVF